nr:MAG TPA: ChiA1-BD-binding domain protein [Caudoviricetes sp.]
MAIYIKVNNTEYPATVNGVNNDRMWDGRDTKTVTLTMSYAQAAALLPDNTPWSIVQREMQDVLDEQGQPTGETKEVVNEYDNSEYSIAGDLTDHRDGTVSIKMGKPTETESAKATVTALAGAPVTYARAVELRPIIEQAAVSLSDGEAASVPELITAWAYPVDYAEGDRRSYGGKVYKVRPGQAHTSQADWTPDKTPALWTIINVDHAGTQDDPIPAARGMEYTYGLYYKDPEDTKLYKCERIGEAAGGKIVLQYLPHELVGQYFTEV